MDFLDIQYVKKGLSNFFSIHKYNENIDKISTFLHTGRVRPRPLGHIMLTLVLRGGGIDSIHVF